ncbi:hypothetical protein H0176_22110 [Methylorubrum populi]|nr:hypothetical protein [Methylorubrum rhodesianum]MBY0142946.1 hypothetical protein [Methylorubrum populi]
MPTLFDPIRLGGIDCKNRIFMAPLTRGRATHAHVPTDLIVAGAPSSTRVVHRAGRIVWRCPIPRCGGAVYRAPSPSAGRRAE